MSSINCLIIDDDEIDRLTVQSFVNRTPIFNLRGVFEDAFDAMNVLENEKIDVLFLDIDMPSISGIEVRKQFKDIPICVFITSYPEFAVESFELNTLDFIVKPLNFERFSQAVIRIQEYLELREKAYLFENSIGGDIIYIKEGTQQIKIKLYDILYLEALKDYTKIVMSDNRFCVLSSLGVLIKEDNFTKFVRIHRSYAIQKHQVSKIQSGEVILNNNLSLPVGRSYKDNLTLLQ